MSALAGSRPEHREGLCWYCCEESATHAVPFLFHRVVDASYGAGVLDSRMVYYRSAVESVAVPRCDTCATLHRQEKSLKVAAGVLVIVGCLLSFAVAYYMFRAFGPGPQNPDSSALLMFVPFFASLLLAVGPLVRSEDYKRRGIREEGQIGEWPRVQELLEAGYDPGDRPLGSHRVA